MFFKCVIFDVVLPRDISSPFFIVFFHVEICLNFIISLKKFVISLKQKWNIKILNALKDLINKKGKLEALLSQWKLVMDSWMEKH